jgi:hypothetical protein
MPPHYVIACKRNKQLNAQQDIYQFCHDALPGGRVLDVLLANPMNLKNLSQWLVQLREGGDL